MWSNTRMVVLTAVAAAVYAAVLIPFKAIPVIPGLTEIRPAAALPPLCSILFGPAGAWGAAFGNLIGDFFGMLGPGSIFGFLGNFLYGYIPYRAWRALSDQEPQRLSPAGWAKLLLAFLLGAGACALVIAWGVDLLGLAPFKALVNIILLNNALMALLISPFLVAILYPMIKNFGLLATDLLEPAPRSRLSRVGLVLLIIGILGGLLAGNLLAFGALNPASLGLPALSLPWLVSPFLLILLLGVVLA
jgi:energy-coupling factor transport system substrate-specific component